MTAKMESVMVVTFLALVACVAIAVVIIKIAQNLTSTGQEGIF